MYHHRPVLSRGETIDSCCSEDTDPVTVLEVRHHHLTENLNFNPLVKDPQKKTLTQVICVRDALREKNGIM